MKPRVAIIGAGPIGLEAALAASAQGYGVEVFECGQRVAASVLKWGHVRMFSPFAMNSSSLGRARLKERGFAVPDEGALLTGKEFAENYLIPLAETLDVPIHLDCEVLAIGRERTRKGEKIGLPARADSPFRLLTRQFEERMTNTNVIFDCSGTFLNPKPVGDGGIPAVGEATAVNQGRISHGLPEASEFTHQNIMVVGGGHSAATVVRDLANLGNVQITWVIRKPSGPPCRRFENDPLAARDELSAQANELAEQIDFRPGASVAAIASTARGLRVTLNQKGSPEVVEVDHLIAATGYQPDQNLARELQVQTCWATEGAYQLAAQLLGEEAGDCLAAPGTGVETLVHPEPGYFALGMKSYGRTPDFLIRTGHQQIATVLEFLGRR